MNHLECAIEEINAWYENRKYPEAYCPRIEKKLDVLEIIQDALVDKEILAIGCILEKHSSVWYVVGGGNEKIIIVARFAPEVAK